MSRTYVNINRQFAIKYRSIILDCESTQKEDKRLLTHHNLKNNGITHTYSFRI
ncbi:MAG: hypothetical protein ACI85O_003552 [Saprospiraceae bacterium]|jgi:hypothetical protein